MQDQFTTNNLNESIVSIAYYKPACYIVSYEKQPP